MRTRHGAILAIVLLLSGVGRVAQAYPSVDATTSLMSAFHDTSNFWISDTAYGFNLYNGPSDPALYINQINFSYTSGTTPGTGVYDPNIGLATPASTTYQTGFGSYTLGTPLAPDTLMYLYNAVSRSGDVNASVANGIYDFNLEVLGGYDSSASDILGIIPYQIQIADGINVSASASVSASSISAGQTSTVSVKVVNDDPTQTFISTTWFVSAFSNGPDYLHFDDFVGDWFDKSIAPGDDLTGLHSTWSADNTMSAGTYTGLVGVVGGLVNGDNMYILADPGPVIEVVPEPASMGLALIVGASWMLGRSRSN